MICEGRGNIVGEFVNFIEIQTNSSDLSFQSAAWFNDRFNWPKNCETTGNIADKELSLTGEVREALGQK